MKGLAVLVVVTGYMLFAFGPSAQAGLSVTSYLDEDTDIQTGRITPNGAGTTAMMGTLSGINQQESGISLVRFRTREESGTSWWRPRLVIRYSVPQGMLIVIQ